MDALQRFDVRKRSTPEGVVFLAFLSVFFAEAAAGGYVRPAASRAFAHTRTRRTEPARLSRIS